MQSSFGKIFRVFLGAVFSAFGLFSAFPKAVPGFLFAFFTFFFRFFFKAVPGFLFAFFTFFFAPFFEFFFEALPRFFSRGSFAGIHRFFRKHGPAAAVAFVLVVAILFSSSVF